MWSHIYCTAFCTVQCNASQYNTYCYFVLKHSNQYRFYKDHKKKPITSDWSTMMACCELLIQSSKKGSQYVWHWILLTWYEWCRWDVGWWCQSMTKCLSNTTNFHILQDEHKHKAKLWVWCQPSVWRKQLKEMKHNIKEQF